MDHVPKFSMTKVSDTTLQRGKFSQQQAFQYLNLPNPSKVSVMAPHHPSHLVGPLDNRTKSDGCRTEMVQSLFKTPLPLCHVWFHCCTALLFIPFLHLWITLWGGFQSLTVSLSLSLSSLNSISACLLAKAERLLGAIGFPRVQVLALLKEREEGIRAKRELNDFQGRLALAYSDIKVCGWEDEKKVGACLV